MRRLPPGQQRRRARTTFPFISGGSFARETVGDFEYLVRLLQPEPVDEASACAIWTCRSRARASGINRPDLNGALALGGALRVPRIEPERG